MTIDFSVCMTKENHEDRFVLLRIISTVLERKGYFKGFLVSLWKIFGL